MELERLSFVMNNTVYRKQCTIFWHMDDLKILYVISKVVDGVLSQLTAKYGKVSSLSVSRGRLHDYLGLGLNYGTKGKVRITAPKHIESILEASAYDMYGITATSSANHMFTVREYGYTLTITQKDLFWTLVEKIFFVSCRSRPDLKKLLYFITTRVRNLDGDDYNKLARMIRYIRATQGINLTLEVESMDTI